MTEEDTRAIEFLAQEIFEHTAQLQLPNKAKIYEFIESLHDAMFPHSAECLSLSEEQLFGRLQHCQELLLQSLSCQVGDKAKRHELASLFFQRLPEVFHCLRTDAEAHFDADPAANSLEEVYTTYPGFKAVSFFRCAHLLHELGVALVPRIITEYAHQITGIDIHPAAAIGHHFAIDHGTGVVVGETTVIGNHVTIYQGVTLGSISVSKESKNRKRHPTIADHVKIYANATILGGETVIGEHSIIGGNSWVTSSVAPHSKVYRKSA
jgi:serine O-acetyltransferase